MAWRKAADPFPASLREFREGDWPPVDGECLGHYACRGNGYEGDCVPRPGEPCGQRYYAMLALDYPGRPELVAARERHDAFTRFHQARLDWLGKDHPLYVEEFIGGLQTEEKMSREGWRDPPA